MFMYSKSNKERKNHKVLETIFVYSKRFYCTQKSNISHWNIMVSIILE